MKTPRVKRKHDPKVTYTDATYRKKAFPLLMEDFGSRCAYSLLHVAETSKGNMEVDHFNSLQKGKKRHAYGNLYPGFSLCNGAKSQVWPTKNDLKKRRRFLDCCKETDYGVHLFEKRSTGELQPVTPEGVYHVENCDLNNEWLRGKRRKRTDDKIILAALKAGIASPIGPDKELGAEAIAIFEAQIKNNIPDIPELPVGAVAL